tara:strand:+ start:324 stop:722 length:399 start_codon:yes stop_codon:yes gene_type:complete
MADILQFPNKRQQSVNEKVGILRNRLEELAIEADLVADDISYLQDIQVKGIAEGEQIMKEISELIGVAIPPEVEWPEEFEDGTVYPKDTTTDKWDELANTTLDNSLKLLEDAVKQLKFDFNKDKPDDKPKDK